MPFQGGVLTIACELVDAVASANVVVGGPVGRYLELTLTELLGLLSEANLAERDFTMASLDTSVSFGSYLKTHSISSHSRRCAGQPLCSLDRFDRVQVLRSLQDHVLTLRDCATIANNGRLAIR